MRLKAILLASAFVFLIVSCGGKSEQKKKESGKGREDSKNSAFFEPLWRSYGE
jgi:uncharacterized lipoprotein